MTDFIATVKKENLARQSRFAVILYTPTFGNMTADTQSDTESTVVDSSYWKLLTLFCEASQIPGMTFLTNPVQTYGETREMPYGRLFDPAMMSFYVDAEMKLKIFFDAWMDYIINGGIVNQEGTRHVQYYDNYTTTIEILQQDQKDRDVYKTTLYEAYPKAINPMALEYGSRDFHRLQVTFVYKYWKSEIISNPDSKSEKSPLNFLINTALTVLDQIKLGTSGVSSMIPSVAGITSASSYFKSFNTFQKTINSNLHKVGSGISTTLGKII